MIAIGIYAVLTFLLLAPPAWAATVTSSPSLVLQSKQTWTILIGALVPLVTYVLNHVGPWVSETVKAFVTVLAAGIAGGLYTALATTSFGFNSATLQMVLTSIAAALAAHQLLWKPSGIAAKLGAGTNGPLGSHLIWQKDGAPAEPESPAA